MIRPRPFAAHINAMRAARRLRRRRYNYPSIQAEPKYQDQTYTGNIAYDANFVGCEANPAAVGTLTACAIGDGHQNRDGKKIIMTQIEVKGVVTMPSEVGQTAATIDHPPVVFLAMILDTQTNGVETQAENVFMTSIASGAHKIPIRNLLYGGRFRVLKFKRLTFNNFVTAPQDTTVANGTHIRYAVFKFFKMFKKLRLPVNFNAGTTNDVANVQDNNISLIAWQNNSTAAPTLNYHVRTRWIG